MTKYNFDSFVCESKEMNVFVYLEANVALTGRS